MKNAKGLIASGFTLVELAIVLMIIGLLIGGILKGQELINNAKIHMAIRQENSYEGAVIAFRDAYGAFPGDIASATTRIPNCTAGNNCQGGDGNGIIGATSSVAYGGVDAALTSENTQFWKHLALANLISGVSGSAGSVAWGETHPAAGIGGGFFITSALRHIDGNPVGGARHYFILRGQIAGGACWDVSSTALCALSPREAARIDRKLDDGAALTGDVVSVSAAYNNGCGNGSDNGYSNGTEKTCDTQFRQ